VDVRLRAGRAWELEVIFATLRLLTNRLSPTTRELAWSAAWIRSGRCSHA